MTNELLLIIASAFVLLVAALYKIVGWIAYKNADPIVFDSSLPKLLGRLENAAAVIKAVIAVAIFLSTLLVIMVFLKHAGFNVMKALTAYASIMSIVVVGRYFRHAFGLNSRANLTFILLSILVTASWLFYPNWLTLDIAAFLLAVMMLLVFRNTPFLTAVVLSLGVMIYDAVAVFGTKMMQKAAGGMSNLPMLFTIPSALSFHCKPLFMLGVGDVVLPGILVMVAMREAKKYSLPWLGRAAILGYVAGFFISLAVVSVTRFVQPATIYLIPCTFLGFVLVAWRKNILKKLS